MDRNLDNYLSQWKQKKSRKPLLLRGARQTGKSYALEKLGKRFDSCVCLNFEKNPSLSGLFTLDLDPKRILREIEAFHGSKIIPGKTFVFFDEIQVCPLAVTALRYFYEDIPDLHVAGAGSLLEFELEKISMPVGRIEFVYVHPFTFLEFLHAVGKEMLAQYVGELSYEKPPDDFIHDQLLTLLREYLYVGGMPGVLEAFVEDNSYLSAMEEQQSIIATYRADFNKYCGRAGTEYITRVFESAPKFVGNKVTYSKIDPDARAEQIKNAINLLEKAHIMKKVRATSGSGVPLAAGASEKWYKLILFDVGLMQCLLGTRYQDWKERSATASALTGAITEQYVGQELATLEGTHRNQDLYYWVRTARGAAAEVDYLAAIQGAVVPIEVKSSAFGHLKSLNALLTKYPNVSLGIKASEQNFARSGNILAVPLYSISRLEDILAKGRIL